MCYSSGKKQARAAEQRAAEAEASKRSGMARVNELFGVGEGGAAPTGRAATNQTLRQQLLDRLYGDTNAFYRNDIEKQGVIAKRNLKFNLARTGNLGGSVDVDKSGALTDVRTRALLDASNKADLTRQSASNADEESRLDLIRQITAGVDTNTALSGANIALQRNIADAGYNARNSVLGNAFEQFADALPYANLSGQDPAMLSDQRRRRGRYQARRDEGIGG